MRMIDAPPTPLADVKKAVYSFGTGYYLEGQAMKVFSIVAAAAMGVAFPASAEWVGSKGSDDPFKGGAEYIAMALTNESRMSAAFRCTSEDDLALVFITPETPTQDFISTYERMDDVAVLVVIDDQPKRSLAARLEITADASRVRFDADGLGIGALLHAAAGAKKRFAIAGEIKGKVVYSQSFTATGSRRAITPLIEGCKISPAAAKTN